MIRWWLLLLLGAGGLALPCAAREPEAKQLEIKQLEIKPGYDPALASFLQRHCVDCHDAGDRQGGLALDSLLSKDLAANSDAWEKVVRKLTARQMPPRESKRPAEAEYRAALAWLESQLDAAAAKSPNPGRTETFRRLNRTEYRHAIRDLLALDVEVAALLPPDESSHGFDNITVANLSPALLQRYLAAAQKISRLAVAAASRSSPGASRPAAMPRSSSSSSSVR